MEAIKAVTRSTDGGQSINELRRRGWVPAVVYGTKVNNLPISIKGKELDQALRDQTTNKPFKLSIDDEEHDVMVYELQRHPVAGIILHVDFKQINMNEKVHTSVPILMTGDPELGVATLVRHSLEVTCLPNNIPESLTVNIDGLNIGDVILVKDLPIPDSVEIGLDELEVVISVLAPKEKSDESIEAGQAAETVAEHAGSKTEEASKV